MGLFGRRRTRFAFGDMVSPVSLSGETGVRIENHRLNPGWYKESPNQGGALAGPTLIVMHYTASGGDTGQGDADFLASAAAPASAHVVVGRGGDVRQIVPFDRKAWHAGQSVWRGRPNVNDFSIGIEIDNWGRLAKAASGEVVSSTGVAVDPGKAVELTHKNETASAFWEVYPEAQLRVLVELTRLLLETYPTLNEIVGHDDVAPGRKSDPGPAFPMERFRSLVQGRGDQPLVRRTVNASALNLRGGPGTTYDKVGKPLKRGARVDVLFDGGDWSRVKVGDGRVGWVRDEWLS